MNKRQEKILEILKQQGEVSIHEFARMLNVSEMTIHRDAAVMEEKGLLYKKRGALSFVEESAQNHDGYYLYEKQAIARMALTLIKDVDSIIFDNSTTALEVAKLLANWKKKNKKLTVYATNLEVANAVCKNPDITLYVSGGYYMSSTTGFVGSITEEFIERVHAEKCILGMSGISAEYGLTGPYTYHNSLERKIIAAAKEVIVVADHSKFGKVALEKVADLSEVDYIITDAKVSNATVEEFSTKTKLLIAR